MRKAIGQKPTQIINRVYECVWCEKAIYQRSNDWVADGSGDLLHYDCFNERLGILNENSKK